MRSSFLCRFLRKPRADVAPQSGSGSAVSGACVRCGSARLGSAQNRPEPVRPWRNHGGACPLRSGRLGGQPREQPHHGRREAAGRRRRRRAGAGLQVGGPDGGSEPAHPGVQQARPAGVRRPAGPGDPHGQGLHLLHAGDGPEAGPEAPGGQRVPAAVGGRPGGRGGHGPGRADRLRPRHRLRHGLHAAGAGAEAARPEPAGDPGHAALGAGPLVAQPPPLRRGNHQQVEGLLHRGGAHQRRRQLLLLPHAGGRLVLPVHLPGAAGGAEEAAEGDAARGEGGAQRHRHLRHPGRGQQPHAVRHRARGVLQRLAGRGPELADGEPLLGREDHGGGGDQRLLPGAGVLLQGPQGERVAAVLRPQRGAAEEVHLLQPDARLPGLQGHHHQAAVAAQGRQPLPPAQRHAVGLRPPARQLPGAGRLLRPLPAGPDRRPAALPGEQDVPQLLHPAVQHAGAAVGRGRRAARPQAVLRALRPGRAPALHHRARQGRQPADRGAAVAGQPRQPAVAAVGRRRREPARRPAGQEAAAAGDGEPRKVHLRLHQPGRRHAAALPHRRQVLLRRGVGPGLLLLPLTPPPRPAPPPLKLCFLLFLCSSE